MRYVIRFSPEAADDVRRLPQDLKQFIKENLMELREAPTRLSRPAPTPPYLPGFQLFEFGRNFKGRFHLFAVLFNYNADETHLEVAAIGHVEYDRPMDD